MLSLIHISMLLFETPQDALRDAKLSKSDIDEVLLVGGSTPVSYTHLDVYKRQEYK